VGVGALDGEFLKGEVCKVDTTLGLVFGWGIVCCEKNSQGEWDDHYDLQGDHIPEFVMLEGSSDFMENSRDAHDMHTGKSVGSIVHSFPLTRDVAEKMGITTKQTGWMIAMKPNADVLQKFATGEYKGFSIGGNCDYVLQEAV
jgi:hypothetical protein